MVSVGAEQSFLVETKWLNRLLATADPSHEDVVFLVGGGNGQIVLLTDGVVKLIDTISSLNIVVGFHPLGVDGVISVCLKNGEYKVTANNITNTYTASLTTGKTISSLYIGAITGSNYYSGIAYDLTIDEELFSLNNTLEGDQGTTAVLTGSTEPVFFANGIVNKINTNPNPTSTDGQVLLARGFSGYQTRAELDLLHDALVDFTSPIPNASTLPPDVYRQYIYTALTTLTQAQIDKLNKRVGRSL